MQKVWVLALAKDCSKTLTKNLENLDVFLEGFEVYWAILESNSEDNTRSILEQWRLAGSRRWLLGEPSGVADELSRTEKMALRRNHLKEFCQSQVATLQAPPLAICVVDLDNELQITAQLSSFLDGNQSRTVIFAHQKPLYYDIWAFRSIEAPHDCFTSIRKEIERGANPFLAYEQNIFQLQRSIAQIQEPIQVSSAFGGLAIYPPGYLDAAHYDGTADCEHVSLNASMVDSGFILTIDPALQTKSVSEHTLFASTRLQGLFGVLTKLPPKPALVLFKTLLSLLRLLRGTKLKKLL